jgi:hypothetical protein
MPSLCALTGKKPLHWWRVKPELDMLSKASGTMRQAAGALRLELHTYAGATPQKCLDWFSFHVWSQDTSKNWLLHVDDKE